MVTGVYVCKTIKDQRSKICRSCPTNNFQTTNNFCTEIKDNIKEHIRLKNTDCPKKNWDKLKK